MYIKLLGHVNVGFAVYSLPLSLTLSFFPHSAIPFQNGFVSFLRFTFSTSQKSDCQHVDSQSFFWTRSLPVTYFVKAEKEDPPLSPMPEAVQEHGFVQEQRIAPRALISKGWQLVLTCRLI